MRRLAREARGAGNWFLCAMICRLDHMLRMAWGIREYSDARDCLLRIAKVRWNRTVQLEDGTMVSRGDWIGELHLWNEHVSQLCGSRKGLAAGASFRAKMKHSLRSLAVYVAIEPEMRNVVAFHGRVSRIGHPARRDWQSLVSNYRCDLQLSRPSLFERIHDSLGFLLTMALAWAFNPKHPVMRGISIGRVDIWISRQTLLRHFAPTCGPVSHENLQKASES